MPTSALRAFLVPRSSDPPGRSRSQGCARLRGRGPGGGARGGLAREGHGRVRGAGFGSGAFMLFAWNAAAGSPEGAPCVGEVEGRSLLSLTTRCRPSPEGVAPRRQAPGTRRTRLSIQELPPVRVEAGVPQQSLRGPHPTGGFHALGSLPRTWSIPWVDPRGRLMCSFFQWTRASYQPFLEGDTGPGVTRGRLSWEDRPSSEVGGQRRVSFGLLTCSRSTSVFADFTCGSHRMTHWPHSRGQREN